MERFTVDGIVTQGFRIASGLNTEGVPGPRGIIIKDSFPSQRPFFEKEIPEMKEMWTGTINVNISPLEHEMIGFHHVITCTWHPEITETFGFAKNVILTHKGKKYPAIIYYPMPSEFHEPRLEVIEILAPKVENLEYADEVSLLLPADKVTLKRKRRRM